MLVRFYDPVVKGADEQGRTLDGILAWDDDTLEHTHDYIQTLFPLPEPSGVRDNAPLITPEVREAFLSRPELRQELISAFDRMLTFFGLQYHNIPDSHDSVDWNPETDLTHAIADGPNWPTTCLRWLVHRNHNHMRISRIIRSLKVLGCEEESCAFYCFLEHDKNVCGIVSQNSQAYWARAAKGKLWLPPHELDQNAEGTAWLRTNGNVSK
jgi:hypothetical protein